MPAVPAASVPVPQGGQLMMVVPVSANTVATQPTTTTPEEDAAADATVCVLAPSEDFTLPAIGTTGSFRVDDTTCFLALPSIWGERFLDLPGIGTIAITNISESGGLMSYRNVNIAPGTVIAATSLFRLADLSWVLEQACSELVASCQCAEDDPEVTGYWACTSEGLRLITTALRVNRSTDSSSSTQTLSGTGNLDKTTTITVMGSGYGAVVVSASLRLNPDYTWVSSPATPLLKTLFDDRARFILKIGDLIIGHADANGLSRDLTLTGTAKLLAGNHEISIECTVFGFSVDLDVESVQYQTITIA